MSTETENQEKEEKQKSEQQGNNNEDIAKQIPTVIPDTENPEPGPDEEDDK